MAEPFSSESPLTLGLAIVAVGAVVTALRAIFGMRDAIREEFEDKYVLKETLNTKLDSMKASLEQLEHVHTCIHRLERKMDNVIARNTRKDENGDE